MFTVLDPLHEFTYHLLSSWRKFALCIQSLLRMLFLFGWSPCQRSDMIWVEVSQRAYNMIHYISGLFGYLYVCEIYVNLIPVPIYFEYILSGSESESVVHSALTQVSFHEWRQYKETFMMIVPVLFALHMFTAILTSLKHVRVHQATI